MGSYYKATDEDTEAACSFIEQHIQDNFDYAKREVGAQILFSAFDFLMDKDFQLERYTHE